MCSSSVRSASAESCPMSGASLRRLHLHSARTRRPSGLPRTSPMRRLSCRDGESAASSSSRMSRPSGRKQQARGAHRMDGGVRHLQLSQSRHGAVIGFTLPSPQGPSPQQLTCFDRSRAHVYAASTQTPASSTALAMEHRQGVALLPFDAVRHRRGVSGICGETRRCMIPERRSSSDAPSFGAA